MGCLSKKSRWLSSNVVSVLTTSRSSCADGLLPSHLIVWSLCLPLPLHLIFCMFWRITFQCQCFLKGMGYLRCSLDVQRHDGCSTVDRPGWAGCESTLLMANLLVFSAVHQRLSSHGGQEENLGYCRGISHEKIYAPRARDRWVILLQREKSLWGASGCTRE